MPPWLCAGSGASPAHHCACANPNLQATVIFFEKQTMTGQYIIPNAFQVTMSAMCFSFALISFPLLANYADYYGTS